MKNINENEKADITRTDSINEDDSFIDDDYDFLQEDQFLTFLINNETYGINILTIREIIQLVKITSIPESLDFIKGVINLRGIIIPIMDIRIRFGIEEIEADERTCIIVVRIGDIQMGLIVDRVEEVIEISSENIGPMPKVDSATHHRFVKGFGKLGEEVIILLDLDKLLFEEEKKKLKQI